MDLDGIQRATMGKARWFGRLVYCSFENSNTKLVGGVFAHLGVHKGWRNLSCCLL